jgi:hypothetical protein
VPAILLGFAGLEGVEMAVPSVDGCAVIDAGAEELS